MTCILALGGIRSNEIYALLCTPSTISISLWVVLPFARWITLFLSCTPYKMQRTHSASTVLYATTVCRRAAQVTGPPEISNANPLTLFQVSGQLPQSESQYPSNLISFILDVFPFAGFLKKMPFSVVAFKYLRTRLRYPPWLTAGCSANRTHLSNLVTQDLALYLSPCTLVRLWLLGIQTLAPYL